MLHNFLRMKRKELSWKVNNIIASDMAYKQVYSSQMRAYLCTNTTILTQSHSLPVLYLVTQKE